MKTKRLLGFVAIAVASVGILAACGKDAAKDQTVVRVGTMAKSESEQARWDKIEEILKKEGITLKFSEFTDYSQPNVALNNGDIDINAFQHYNFLDNWNSDHKTDLVPIAETYFTAFRVYSGTEGGKNKYKDIKELPEGATIAIPNDAVNESRALNLLQSAGLIKLSVGANDKAKLTDVSENSKNLNIREVDAAQTAANIDSVDAAIINNDFVTEAGIDPKTAIYVEPASKNTKQWYNLLVAQKRLGKNQIRLMLSRKLSRLIILTKSKESSRNHLKVWMNQFGKRGRYGKSYFCRRVLLVHGATF